MVEEPGVWEDSGSLNLHMGRSYPTQRAPVFKEFHGHEVNYGKPF